MSVRDPKSIEWKCKKIESMNIRVRNNSMTSNSDYSGHYCDGE